MRGLTAEARASFGPDHEPPAAPCAQGKGGAYSLAFRKRDEHRDLGGFFVGEAVIVHVDERGKVARSIPRTYVYDGKVGTRIELLGTADYDDDGVAELLVQHWRGATTTEQETTAEVLQVVGENIEPYPPAEEFSVRAFKDVDGDGRPDLLLEPPFLGSPSGCDTFELGFGPDWIAHALPDGLFAFDAVSRAELERTCPERPPAIVPRVAGGIDNDELRRRVTCAVVWGTPQAVIQKELRRDCPVQVAAIADCAYQGVLPVCVNVPLLVQWSSVEVPFFLP